MSMYTQLLSAAIGRGPSELAGASERGAFDEVLRSRAELGSAPAADPDVVSAVLAREVAYDVALLRLARTVGVESGPDRFEQPELERARLEGALRGRGISLEPDGGGDAPSSASR